MFYKRIKFQIRELKMFTVLLFTLISFFVFDYSFISNAEQLCSENFSVNGSGSDDDFNKKRLKIQRNYAVTYDKMNLSDTALKNVFVAFKYFQDDNQDNSLFSMLKNGQDSQGYFDISFDIFHNSFDIKLWYRLIIWATLFVIFLESISISVKNIIYIHKSDGKKGLYNINLSI